MTASTAAVLFEVGDGIAQIRLNRPDVLNAIDHSIVEGLHAAAHRIQKDGTVRVVVLSGEGRAFAAGGDLLASQRAGIGAPDVARRLIPPFHEFVKFMADLPIPVLAKLHGPIAGAGVGLALGCDLAIAADDVRFNLAYSRIGASPDGSATWLLPRLVGLRRAMEIVLLSDNVPAAEALRLGLVNWVVPASELDTETDKLAHRLAKGPTFAFGQSKALLRSSFGRDCAAQLAEELEGFVRCAGTADFHEGISAFVEKRTAEFKGN